MRYQDDFEGDVQVTQEKAGVTIVQVKNANGQGSGEITCYDILSGIRLIHNDFHMQKIKSEFIPEEEIFCVDHCREGRIEQEIKQGVFRYVGVGDLRLDNRRNHATNFCFPMSYYQGITIQFEIEKADNSIHVIFPDFPINIAKLRERFCEKENCAYLRNEEYVEHIFTELYHVPAKIRRHYMILKVLELLLWLGSLEESNITEAPSYYTRNQTDKVKKISELITTDFQQHYTLEMLSEKFHISTTSMKKTFKGIYGKPINVWLTEQKMARAATLLLERERNITEIANEVGYESPSKFSAAFKKAMNLTPLEFRRSRNAKED